MQEMVRPKTKQDWDRILKIEKETEQLKKLKEKLKKLYFRGGMWDFMKIDWKGVEIGFF